MLTVATTAPGYTASDTYGAPNAVDSPPAKTASCASTPTAATKAEAYPATAATAEGLDQIELKPQQLVGVIAIHADVLLGHVLVALAQKP